MTLTSLADKGFFLIHDHTGSSMAIFGKIVLSKTPAFLNFWLYIMLLSLWRKEESK